MAQVLLKTPFRPCPLCCGHYLSSVDSHDRCLQCLGIQLAEAAFVDGLCVHCERITMAALRSCLSLLTGMGRAPSATTCAGFSAMSREPLASALGDLRATVRASPLGQSPQTSHSSRSSCSVRLPGDSAVTSDGVPSVSFGVPIEDQMSIAASVDGLSFSEDEDSAGLPPSGVVATAESDPELTDMLSRAAVNIGLEVCTPPSPEPSRRDDWFLGMGRGLRPRPALVPFFPEVHEELM